MDRQAIRAAHIESGEPDPTASEGVRRVLRGLSRQRAREGRRQAAALTAEALGAIRATAATPRTGPTGHTESLGAARRRGYRLGVGYAGRHAPAVRSRRAHVGRRRAPGQRIGTPHRHPLEERSARRRGRSVPRQVRRKGAAAHTEHGPGCPRVRPPLRPFRASAPRRHGTGRQPRRRISPDSTRVGMARDLVAHGASSRRAGPSPGSTRI